MFITNQNCNFLTSYKCINKYLTCTCCFSQSNNQLKQNTTNMRITLECFKTMTYNLNNDSCDVLQGIHAKLHSLLQEFQKQLPQCHGLLIRPQLRKQLKKSYQRKFTLKRLKLLPKSTTKRKKLNLKFRARVGRKASILRKVCI